MLCREMEHVRCCLVMSSTLGLHGDYFLVVALFLLGHWSTGSCCTFHCIYEYSVNITSIFRLNSHIHFSVSFFSHKYICTLLLVMWFILFTTHTQNVYYLLLPFLHIIYLSLYCRHISTFYWLLHISTTSTSIIIVSVLYWCCLYYLYICYHSQHLVICAFFWWSAAGIQVELFGTIVTKHNSAGITQLTSVVRTRLLSTVFCGNSSHFLLHHSSVFLGFCDSSAWKQPSICLSL